MGCQHLESLETYYLAHKTCCNITLSAVIVLYFVAKKLLLNLKLKKMRAQNAENVKQRQAACEKSFEKNFDLKGVISIELEKEILNSDIKGLRKLLLAKKVSSINLTKFYYMRAKTKGRELKAAIESNIDNALVLAKAADIKLATANESIFEEFPILGIPFSVKESISMEGFDITQGFATRVGHPEEKTAPMIQELINKGGIPFVRTNIPQALMAIESTNEIYGTCLNSFSESRTSGGSSGGEGSLIGALCSPFGIGSDIGGSIRNPAHNNGIFAIKTTTNRIGTKGHPSISPFFGEHSHQHYIGLVMGPLCKSADDVEIITSILTSEKLNNQSSPECPPTNWESDKLEIDCKKIKVGYFTEIKEMCGSSRLTQKAVSAAIASLENSGVECVKFVAPTYTKRMIALLMTILQLDGNLDSFFDINRHGIAVE